MSDQANSIQEDTEALAQRIAIEGVSVNLAVIHLLRTLDTLLNVADRTRNDRWLAAIVHWIISRLVQFND